MFSATESFIDIGFPRAGLSESSDGDGFRRNSDAVIKRRQDVQDVSDIRPRSIDDLARVFTSTGLGKVVDAFYFDNYLSQNSGRADFAKNNGSVPFVKSAVADYSVQVALFELSGGHYRVRLNPNAVSDSLILNYVAPEEKVVQAKPEVMPEPEAHNDSFSFGYESITSNVVQMHSLFTSSQFYEKVSVDYESAKPSTSIGHDYSDNSLFMNQDPLLAGARYFGREVGYEKEKKDDFYQPVKSGNDVYSSLPKTNVNRVYKLDSGQDFSFIDPKESEHYVSNQNVITHDNDNFVWEQGVVHEENRPLIREHYQQNKERNERRDDDREPNRNTEEIMFEKYRKPEVKIVESYNTVEIDNSVSIVPTLFDAVNDNFVFNSIREMPVLQFDDVLSRYVPGNDTVALDGFEFDEIKVHDFSYVKPVSYAPEGEVDTLMSLDLDVKPTVNRDYRNKNVARSYETVALLSLFDDVDVSVPDIGIDSLEEKLFIPREEHKGIAQKIYGKNKRKDFENEEALANLDKLIGEYEKLGFCSISIEVYYTKTGEHYSHNADAFVSTPSINKLPLAFAIQYYAQEGKIDLDAEITINKELAHHREINTYELTPGKKVTVRDMVKLMVEDSVNSATNHLVAYLGEGDFEKGKVVFNETMKELGIGSIAINDTYKRDSNYFSNGASLRDLTLFQQMLHESSVLKGKYLDALKEYMSNERWTEGMRKSENLKDAYMKPTITQKGIGITGYVNGVAYSIMVNEPRGDLYNFATDKRNMQKGHDATDLGKRATILVSKFASYMGKAAAQSRI